MTTIRTKLYDIAGQEGNDGEIYDLIQEAAEYIGWLELLVQDQCGLSQQEIYECWKKASNNC